VDRDPGTLMVQVRARDAAAFEALYDDHHRLVYGLALRMLGDVPSAQDVTQAVFLKVWTSPNLFAGGNFAGWILRITRNRCLDVLRSRASHQEEELPDGLPENEPIEEAAFARLNAGLVRKALETLPPDQREPIELGFFSGLTHEEIARRTGAPLGTIKTRIRSGLRKLRTSLEDTVAV
jgi:RNA polymerase sigma-70 factor, ECF subfamily